MWERWLTDHGRSYVPGASAPGALAGLSQPSAVSARAWLFRSAQGPCRAVSAEFAVIPSLLYSYALDPIRALSQRGRGESNAALGAARFGSPTRERSPAIRRRALLHPQLHAAVR